MEYAKDTMARAKMTNVVVSPKDSREVSAALRGKSVAAGLALLSDVKEKKRAIRFTRYNSESAGHRKGIGPGRYPLKAAMAFEDLLESVRSNAEFKDLDPEILRIVHIKADIAARPFRYGRHRGRQGKRANIEVIVQEDEALKKKAKKQTVTATKQKATSQKADASADAKKADAKEPKAAEAKAPKPETKAEPEAKAGKAAAAPKAETKSESKPAKSEAKTEAKDEAAPKPEAKEPKESKKGETQ